MPDDGECFFHGVEPIPDKYFLLCVECGHVFVTEQELLDETKKVYEEIGLPLESVPTSAEKVHTCPLCAHDF